MGSPLVIVPAHVISNVLLIEAKWPQVSHLPQDEAAANALRHLAEIAEPVKVLGIYPAAR